MEENGNDWSADGAMMRSFWATWLRVWPSTQIADSLSLSEVAEQMLGSTLVDRAALLCEVSLEGHVIARSALQNTGQWWCDHGNGCWFVL